MDERDDQKFKALAADVLDRGRWKQWLEREKKCDLVQAGRDGGTLEGFREHVRKALEANPALLKILVADTMDAIDDF